MIAQNRGRSPRGGRVRMSALPGVVPAIMYHVYSNTGVGDPINYTTPVATLATPTWSTGVLNSGGDYKFAVRSFDALTGFEEQNLDATVEIILDALGDDVTSRPLPPIGLRARASSGGEILVEWSNAVVDRSRQPVGFHVYIGAGDTPDYSRPAAIVAYSNGIMNTFQAVLSGLSAGAAYAVGVRAYNATAEESNTTAVIVTADAIGPSPVDSLTAVAIP